MSFILFYFLRITLCPSLIEHSLNNFFFITPGNMHARALAACSCGACHGLGCMPSQAMTVQCGHVAKALTCTLHGANKLIEHLLTKFFFFFLGPRQLACQGLGYLPTWGMPWTRLRAQAMVAQHGHVAKTPTCTLHGANKLIEHSLNKN